MDEERAIKGIFTFARICVEVDLSQGLSDHITLIFNNSLWKQLLDYENTTFRCRGCMQTGHLQYACPLARKDPKGNKKQQKKAKGWQHTDLLEEEDMQTEPIGNPSESDTQKEHKYTQEENAPNTQLEPYNMKQ